MTRPTACQASSHGVPAMCAWVPQTGLQQASELQRPNAKIEAREAFINQHYQSMYDLLVTVSHLRDCPPCWTP